MPGCDGSSSCEQVLSSKWSLIAGKIPVSGLAMGVYLSMFIAGFYVSNAMEVPVRRLTWAVLLMLAGAVTGMAVWFMVVQKWIMGLFCPYCITEHIIGVAMSVIIIWRGLREYRFLHLTALVAIGLALSGIIAASQTGFKPKATYTEGQSQDSLPAIIYRDAPVIGSPDAPYMIKILFDYDCPHCQKVHVMLNDVINRYAGKLAFVLCPTPLNTQCNPYIPRDVDAFKNSCELAKIGLAVWLSKREAFADFDKWMFAPNIGGKWRPRSIEAARAKAIELIGRDKFEAAQSAPWVAQYLQICVQIYGRTIQNGRGGVPKLILGPRWVVPEPNNTDDLIMILQKSLGVPKL